MKKAKAGDSKPLAFALCLGDMTIVPDQPASAIKAACAFLASYRLQCGTPSDHLIQHVLDGFFLKRSGVERLEMDKIRVEGDSHLSSHIGDLKFRQDHAQAFRRACPAGCAVTDDSRGLVVPFVV